MAPYDDDHGHTDDENWNRFDNIIISLTRKNGLMNKLFRMIFRGCVGRRMDVHDDHELVDSELAVGFWHMHSGTG
jgi:hypothetical protein